MTDTNSENPIPGHGYVLADFYADWCEPCKWVNPILDDITKHYGDRIQIQKVDIDRHMVFSKSMHILSVPTLVLFNSGKEIWRIRGFDSADVLIRTIAHYVK